MKRWLPHPALSLGLLACWLILNQSMSPGQILLGSVLSVAIGLLFDRLRPPELKVRKPLLLAKLMGKVSADILRSNIAVASIILGGRWRSMNSGFVEVPLELTDRYALAFLACVITSTPGTIWVRYDPDKQILLIHVFDLIDETEWIRTINDRYQRPLLEVFG